MPRFAPHRRPPRPRSRAPSPAHPGRLLVGSFLTLIAIGTLLLKLPWATPPEQPIGWTDALFTATSASCVTGLVVRDTGAGFTGFGQAVILGLIQAGGLGIMSFSLLILSLLRGRPTFAQRAVYEQTLAGGPQGDVLPLLRLVFLFAFGAEAVGALLLAARWVPEHGAGEGAWAAVFHAVSAFCNAGFGLWPDSLERYRGDAWINSVVMALIVLGGLGFFVVWELVRGRGRWRALSVHSKLALVVSGVLIVAGTGIFWVLEAGNTLFGLTRGEQLLASLFQSVTTRTAGFNTIEIGRLSPPTLFFLTILMFIGGSPGSTAGGVKTTTFGVLVLIMLTRFRGHRNVDAFRRTLTRGTLASTTAIALGGVLTAVGGVFVLLLAEAPARAVEQDSAVFLSLYFEAVSALGTVGLSTGVTGFLEPPSRLIVTILMFLGRLGPLTVASSLAAASTIGDWRYPEEDVVVG
ncbi:MAG TPA: potassium transporter TrkG [Thermoanaerobaculia bacterium]